MLQALVVIRKMPARLWSRQSAHGANLLTKEFWPIILSKVSAPVKQARTKYMKLAVNLHGVFWLIGLNARFQHILIKAICTTILFVTLCPMLTEECSATTLIPIIEKFVSFRITSAGRIICRLLKPMARASRILNGSEEKPEIQESEAWSTKM